MKAGPRLQKPADAKFLDGLADPDPFPDWLTAADRDYYVEQFKQSGFRGPLNRYRKRCLHVALGIRLSNTGRREIALYFLAACSFASGAVAFFANSVCSCGCS